MPGASSAIGVGEPSSPYSGRATGTANQNGEKSRPAPPPAAPAAGGRLPPNGLAAAAAPYGCRLAGLGAVRLLLAAARVAVARPAGWAP